MLNEPLAAIAEVTSHNCIQLSNHKKLHFLHLLAEISHLTIIKLFLVMLATLGWRYLATFFGGSVLVETETDSRPLASGSFGGSVMELFWPSKAWRQTNHQHETQTGHHLEVYTSSWGLLTGQIRVHLGIYGGLPFQSSICMQPFDRNLCLTNNPKNPESRFKICTEPIWQKTSCGVLSGT